jgi:hypothetical protein
MDQYNTSSTWDAHDKESVQASSQSMYRFPEQHVVIAAINAWVWH